ncbi:MAG: YhgE/Pip domain-containing protein [Clostridia bacterium]|nr:YhgE/Pip domain-containing protein [Clostridia bacterium]
MKNILQIFKRDLKNIFTNSMAIILAVGIALLPSLYAWFNIFANWDPYGSTGNMQVAVIIEDEGYRYRGIDINVGERIQSNLAANDAIDWQFLPKEEAMEGIESGKYYAGIEIPKGFSQSLTSIVTSDFVQPQITYYANEKKNAIATKITDKVVQTVQLEVNESFVTTVINVVSSMLGAITQATKDDAGNMLADLQSKLESAVTSVDNIQKTVDSFESVMKVSQSLGNVINGDKLKKALDNSDALIKSGSDMAKLLENGIETLSASADSALSKTAGELNDTAALIGDIGSQSAAKAADTAAKALSKMTQFRAAIATVENMLENIRQSLSLQSDALDTLIEKLDGACTRMDIIISVLSDIAGGAAQSKVNQITSEVTALAQDLTGFSSQYENDIEPVVNKNLTALIDMLSVTGSMVTDLNADYPALKELAKSLDTSVESGADLVKALDKVLGNTKKQLSSLSKRIDGLKDNEIINTIQNISAKNSEQLGEFIACPVKVDTQKIYGIENYGSAMAPFYSTLALWVGAMILIAVMKTGVKHQNQIGNVKMHQSYFGRMLTFLLFSVTQSLIICLGDLFFLKVQCYHPFKFILAGVLAAIAFTVFIYSITAAFGDIGKAIGIIFLVVQIGGSGGTFPIDVTPAFFRVINPYLPFTFVIEAMRECVCGTYAGDYWMDLLKLTAYIAIGLIIGLGVKRLIKNPVRFFEKKIKQTELF